LLVIAINPMVSAKAASPNPASRLSSVMLSADEKSDSGCKVVDDDADVVQSPIVMSLGMGDAVRAEAVRGGLSAPW
jgi:hypothetical protein